MSVDDVLLLGRVLFVAALYGFLALLAVLLRRELLVPAGRAEDRAPADLLVMEPYETGYDVGERIPLLSVSSIGRNAENAVVLDDSFISGEHARLLWSGKAWVLEDLGSTNGTHINGHIVKNTASVHPGDVIELGRVKLKLVPA